MYIDDRNSLILMFIGTPSAMEDCEERKLRVNELNGVNKILSWH